MRTDRKKYKQPSMRVVKLRQRAKMLAGSPVNATMNSTFKEKNWDDPDS